VILTEVGKDRFIGVRCRDEPGGVIAGACVVDHNFVGVELAIEVFRISPCDSECTG
jgi:hypothetical protein